MSNVFASSVVAAVIWIPVGVALFIMLSGCQTQQIYDGEEVSPPWGAVQFCNDNPEHESCQ